MARKKGEKDFSVDEYFGGQSKKRGEDDEDISRLLAAARRKKELEEQRREYELERYERLSDVGRRAEREERREERGERRHGEAEEEKGEKIRSTPVAALMYLLRAFAIAVMLLLMLFVLEKRVPGFEAVADWAPSADTFIGFVLANFVLFLALFVVLFGIEIAYYIVYWVAHKKWKAYDRSEVVYSVIFALIGLVGSAAIILALGY